MTGHYPLPCGQLVTTPSFTDPRTFAREGDPFNGLYDPCGHCVCTDEEATEYVKQWAERSEFAAEHVDMFIAKCLEAKSKPPHPNDTRTFPYHPWKSNCFTCGKVLEEDEEVDIMVPLFDFMNAHQKFCPACFELEEWDH